MGVLIEKLIIHIYRLGNNIFLMRISDEKKVIDADIDDLFEWFDLKDVDDIRSLQQGQGLEVTPYFRLGPLPTISRTKKRDQ